MWAAQGGGLRVGGSKPKRRKKTIIIIISKQEQSSSSDDLCSRNAYAVDDVDVAVEGRQIGGDYLGISDAEALNNNIHFHPKPQRMLIFLVRVHIHTPLHLLTSQTVGEFMVGSLVPASLSRSSTE